MLSSSKCFIGCFTHCFHRNTSDINYIDYSHQALIDVPIEIFKYERTLEKLNLSSNRVSIFVLFDCI